MWPMFFCRCVLFVQLHQIPTGALLLNDAFLTRPVLFFALKGVLRLFERLRVLQE